MDTPEYFPKVFPADRFPMFDWENAPTLPKRAWTTETTHRDGQQGGLPLTAKQGTQLYAHMCAFTGNSGAIRQAEFFVYRPEDRAMLEGALEQYQSGAPIEPTTWIRAAPQDVNLIQTLGIRETGMLASISDFHTFHKFNPGGRDVASRQYLSAVEMVLDAGIRPRLHLEDATRAPIGFLLEFAEAVLNTAQKYGVTPKFRICDTLGLGLPLDNVRLPRSVPRIVRSILDLGVASEDLEFHPHNDTHLAVANAISAVQAGCSVINGTLFAKGERTGNVPLEAVLMHLMGMGYFAENAPDFTQLGALVSYYESMGQPLAAKYPLFGRDAHRTRAGIHADGLNKFWQMYAPFNVSKLLGRPLEVSITKESGLAGLIFLIKQHTGTELKKDDPVLSTLHTWVQDQFANGRQTAIEWEELAVQMEALGNGPSGNLQKIQT